MRNTAEQWYCLISILEQRDSLCSLCIEFGYLCKQTSSVLIYCMCCYGFNVSCLQKVELWDLDLLVYFADQKIWTFWMNAATPAT